MGYRIEYDRGNGKYEVTQERPSGFLLYLAGMVVLLFLMLHFLPEEGASLRSILIPGEDAVTVQAFRAMTDDLRSGADLGEALESFCLQVIHGN